MGLLELYAQEQAETDLLIDNAIVTIQAYLEGNASSNALDALKDEIEVTQMARQARETWHE